MREHQGPFPWLSAALRHSWAAIFRLQAGQRRSLLDDTKMGAASLRLWCWRRGGNLTECKQSFAHLLPDEIADTGGIKVLGQQLYRMRPRPSSLLEGARDHPRTPDQDRRPCTGSSQLVGISDLLCKRLPWGRKCGGLNLTGGAAGKVVRWSPSFGRMAWSRRPHPQH
jgi:hypothetical protein